MLSNLPLKALALALASLLWLHVATDKIYEVEQTLPVGMVITSDNRALAAAPPDSLRALVSATGKALLRGNWRKKGVSIRIGETRIGRRELELSTENVAMLDGSGIELHSVLAPRNYRFTVDVIDSALLPVKSLITVVPAAGFVVGSFDSLSPAVVQAIGPKSAIQRLKYAATESQTAQDVSNDLVLRVTLDTGKVYGVSFNPPQVSYRVSVTAVRQKLVDNVAVALLNAPEDGARLEPDELSVIVSGAFDEVKALSVADISVTVDFLRRDSAGFAPVNVSLPPRLKLVSISDSLALILER